MNYHLIKNKLKVRKKEDKEMGGKMASSSHCSDPAKPGLWKHFL